MPRLDAQAPDMVCLQETKLGKDVADRLDAGKICTERVGVIGDLDQSCSSSPTPPFGAEWRF